MELEVPFSPLRAPLPVGFLLTIEFELVLVDRIPPFTAIVAAVAVVTVPLPVAAPVVVAVWWSCAMPGSGTPLMTGEEASLIGANVPPELTPEDPDPVPDPLFDSPGTTRP